jgi:hypothetical protein
MGELRDAFRIIALNSNLLLGDIRSHQRLRLYMPIMFVCFCLKNIFEKI